MEKKVNFIILGIFIITLFASAVGVVLWINNYSSDEKFKYFKVNTKDSVSGIGKKAPVKYRGVIIGEVQDIFINPDNSEEVSILIKVKYTSPIKKDTYALIEPQGITGLSYIQLEGGLNDAPLLQTSKQNPAVIIAKASIFTQLNSTVKKLGDKSIQMLNSVNELLNEKNRKNFESTLSNLSVISKRLEKQTKKFDQIIQNANRVEKESIIAIKHIAHMSDSITHIVQTNGVKTLQKMNDAADSLKNTMDKAEAKMDNGLFDIKNATKEVTVPLSETLQRLDMLLIQTEGLVGELKQSPSDILYKHTNQKLGPGEQK